MTLSEAIAIGNYLSEHQLIWRGHNWFMWPDLMKQYDKEG